MVKQTEKSQTRQVSAATLPPKNICVFCGARPGHKPEHMKLAKALGKDIAARGHSLVYGGGGLGLMGQVAKSAFDAGATVTGIIPHFLKEAEKMLECVDHIYVDNMHERKIAMFEKSDAFIVLPGGIGTLEEAIEVLSWLRLNLHLKPVIFLSDNGYWESLIQTLHHVVDEGFAGESMREDILHASTVEQAFEIMTREILTPRKREPLMMKDGGSIVACA